MSWEMLMIRTKTNSESIYDIKSENIIPFTQTEIADEIKKIAAELDAEYDCDDLSWPYLSSGTNSERSDRWVVEFGVGEDEETESVMLRIRGSEKLKAVLTALIADLNTRIIDGPTGDFIS